MSVSRPKIIAAVLLAGALLAAPACAQEGTGCPNRENHRPEPDQLEKLMDAHQGWLDKEGWLHPTIPGRANFCNLDLSGTDLRGAKLSRANLSAAKLSESALFEADLSEADLSGADLRRADLWKANLSRAKLFGQSVRGRADRDRPERRRPVERQSQPGQAIRG